MKRKDGSIDFSDLSPDVADTIRAGQQRQAARSMTKAQRKAAARNKVTIDLPEDLDHLVDRMAKELDIPVSQLFRWFILRGMEITTLDELSAARQPSRSMRYEFVLFPKDASPKGQP